MILYHFIQKIIWQVDKYKNYYKNFFYFSKFVSLKIYNLYISVRKSIENQVAIVRTDKDIATILKLSQTVTIGSIFEMFVVFSNLNPFRAVEPALKLRYRDVNCIGTRNNITFHTCLKQRNLQLGSRGQLTRLILDYKEHH